MATDAPVQIPRQRLSELIEREEKQLNERTQRSKETYERAQEAANSYDNDGRKEGIRQFIDDKSYKPGLGAYDASKQKA